MQKETKERKRKAYSFPTYNEDAVLKFTSELIEKAMAKDVDKK